MVTKKDFEVIADTLREYTYSLEWDEPTQTAAVALVAACLEPTNPRFDATKFIERALYGTGKEV